MHRPEGAGSSRGFPRGGSRRGPEGSSWDKRPDPSSQWQTQGQIVAELPFAGLSPVETASTISNVEYIASYNWLDEKNPTILVPGSPPVWAPPVNLPKLKPDSGFVYRDQNSARFSKYPYEPAVRAIFAMEPQAQTNEIDLVACGSTMGNLLRFARGLEMSFRFDLEFIGNSVFFLRKENSPKEVIEGLYGYGHTFPESHTNWEVDVRGSVSHQRIVRYSFGDLSCLIRFESDGWLPKLSSGEESTPVKIETTPLKPDHGVDISSLLSFSTLRPKAPVVNDHLELNSGGRKIPHKAVFDIKTRVKRKPIDMQAEVLPRLWVTQTPNFIIAYHTNGHFDDVQVQDVREDIQGWEKGNQSSLRRLHAIIHRIIEVAKKSGHGQGLELCRIGSGPLVVRKLLDPEWHALPSDLRRKWAGTVGSEALKLSSGSNSS